MEDIKPSEQTIEQRFVKAWADIKNPPLDSVNPHFKNKYASLKSTLESIRQACIKNGIVYLQALKSNESSLELVSSIRAENGQVTELSRYPVTNSANPQTFGSELTYKKRQQAQADWGIAGDEDDDGQSAAKKPAPASNANDVVKKAVTESVNRMSKAIEAYAVRHNADAKSLKAGVKNRPDYIQTVEYIDKITKEFEE